MSCITRQTGSEAANKPRPERFKKSPGTFEHTKAANKPSSAGCVFLLGRRPQNQSREPETHQSHTQRQPASRRRWGGTAHNAGRRNSSRPACSSNRRRRAARQRSAAGARSRAPLPTLGETSASLAAAMSLLANAATDERGMSTSQDRVQPIVEQLRRGQCSRGLAAASAAAFASASRAKTTRAPAVTAPPLSSPTASARICGCACQPWRTLWTSAPSS